MSEIVEEAHPLNYHSGFFPTHADFFTEMHLISTVHATIPERSYAERAASSRLPHQAWY